MFTASEFWDVMVVELERKGLKIPLETLILEHAKLPKKRMDEWRDLNIPNKTYREAIRDTMNRLVKESQVR